jgi:hypothetical protein
MFPRLIALLFFMPAVANAAGWVDSFRKYHAGVALRAAADGLNLSYKYRGTLDDRLPSGCVGNAPGEWACSAPLNSKTSAGLGLYIQKPFRRQGWFYFAWESSFSLRYVESQLSLPVDAAPQPLHDFRATMLGLSGAYYGRVGFTPPAYFPDVFLMAGLSSSLTGGEIRVNKDYEPTFFWNPIGVNFGFESVLLRFWKDGELGLMLSFDVSTDKTMGWFYEEKDGMSEFKPSVSAFYVGLRLLSPW